MSRQILSVVLHDLLLREAARLEAGGLSRVDAAVDVEVLARHVLGWDRAALLVRRHEPAPAALAAGLAPLVARRAAGEPVAYIIGTREFWGLEFEVTPAVLVPRPETELVVETALSRLAARSDPSTPALVVDVGTGSGCLAVALARTWPDVRVVATDASPSALAVARRNVARHAVEAQVHLLAADLLSAFAGRPFADIVVSNPPYIPEDSADVAPDVRTFEPVGALFSGPTGLAHIEKLVASAGRVLRRGGWLIFELGAGQAGAVGRRLAEAGWANVEIRPDLQGIPAWLSRSAHDVVSPVERRRDGR